MLFNESEQDVYRKLCSSIASSLTPVVCIGESLKDRNQGNLENVLNSQLHLILNNISSSDLEKVVFAYEPVWAIGTGVVASLAQINDTHKTIRSMFSSFGKELAKKVRIVYGGSLNENNVEEILKLPDVDGGLVGGASLNVKSFKEIINKVNKICMK